MEKMKFETVDGTVRNVDKIAEMFPQVVTEVLGEDGKLKRAVKWDVLKELLSGDYVEGGECYDFTWPGKRAAIAEAAKPIRKTLRPCKEESKNWDTTENLYIEGDNLDVLKLLQESYLGKVKMIYIDPPYNTGNDSFIYNDDFIVQEDELFDAQSFLDESGNINFKKNERSNPRFHSKWCSMMYPRLQIAKDLLSDDGVIFISIDSTEVSNLRKICDEVFGMTNMLGHVVRRAKTTSFRGNYFAPRVDYLLVYAKNITSVEKFRSEVDIEQYSKIETNGPRVGERYGDDTAFYLSTLQARPNQRYFIECPDGELVIPPGETFPEKMQDGEKILPYTSDGVWRWEIGSYLEKKNMLSFKRTKTSPLLNQKGEKAHWNIYTKIYLNDKLSDANIPEELFLDFINRQSSKELEMLNIPFDFAKPINLLKYLIKITDNKDSVILDFFAGSSSTAHAVMQLNAEDGGKRKFIMVQLPEVCEEKSEAAKAGYKNICEIGKERIRRAGEKIKEEAGLTAANLDIGFRVFKVADSNMKDVYYSAGEYSQDMLDSLVSNIKEDRTDLDLLYGCLLEWGVELSLPHTSETIDNVTVHTVNNGDLIACFDANIPESAIRTIAKRQPLRAVFRDSSFSSAPQKINVEEIFKLLSPTTTVKVI